MRLSVCAFVCVPFCVQDLAASCNIDVGHCPTESEFQRASKSDISLYKRSSPALHTSLLTAASPQFRLWDWRVRGQIWAF